MIWQKAAFVSISKKNTQLHVLPKGVGPTELGLLLNSIHENRCGFVAYKRGSATCRDLRSYLGRQIRVSVTYAYRTEPQLDAVGQKAFTVNCD